MKFAYPVGLIFMPYVHHTLSFNISLNISFIIFTYQIKSNGLLTSDLHVNNKRIHTSASMWLSVFIWSNQNTRSFCHFIQNSHEVVLIKVKSHTYVYCTSWNMNRDEVAKITVFHFAITNSNEIGDYIQI